MPDGNESLVPEELWVPFRRMVPPAEVRRPQAVVGAEPVVGSAWRRSSSWPSRAEPSGGCSPVFGPPGPSSAVASSCGVGGIPDAAMAALVWWAFGSPVAGSPRNPAQCPPPRPAFTA